MREDVQWVQSNCPSDSLSLRAQLFCKQWGAEKLKGAFGGMKERRMRRAVRQWRSAAAIMLNEERLQLYLRYKACSKVTCACSTMKMKTSLHLHRPEWAQVVRIRPDPGPLVMSV